MLHFHIMRIMKDIEKIKHDPQIKSETCKIKDHFFNMNSFDMDDFTNYLNFFF